MGHELQRDGHLVLPSILTPATVDRLMVALQKVQEREAMCQKKRKGGKEFIALAKKYAPRMENCRKPEYDSGFIGGWQTLRQKFQDLRRLTPGQVAAEQDEFLESVIGHPQMLALARNILGQDIRWDHMTALNRPSGKAGLPYHTHSYADGKFHYTVTDGGEPFP